MEDWGYWKMKNSPRRDFEHPPAFTLNPENWGEKELRDRRPAGVETNNSLLHEVAPRRTVYANPIDLRSILRID